ncbi:MAG: RIP metalloprotease RseP [Rhodobacterales bacterium]|nr:MAG: RIP metalloprotease RseP [Rhodobacterales bacterium]
MAGGIPHAVIAFVVALSVIVAVHEYGHYIVGRWSGISAEVFSIGFGPVLWSRHDRRGTKWQLAAIPLGGYVRFLGDANAASAGKSDDVGEMSPEDLRRTMAGAPLWARAATVFAGPLFNFIFSIVVLFGLYLFIGAPGHPPKVVDMYPLPYEGIEIQPGDRILKIAGTDYPETGLREIVDGLPGQGALIPYEVERNGQVIEVQGPRLFPSRIGEVSQRMPGERAGLQVGDVILSADGQEIVRFLELIDIVEASNGAPVALTVWRDGEVMQFAISPQRKDLPKPDNTFETRWLIGIGNGLFFSPEMEPMGIGAAARNAVQRTYEVGAQSLSGLYHIVAGKISTCNLGGAVGIARVSSAMAKAGPTEFIGFIAFLSTAIGLLNLFPIPVLDGGHLVFYAYEAVTRRKPNEKIMGVLVTIGLVFVLSVMLFGLSNDFLCP